MTTPVGSTLSEDFGVTTALNAGWITREDASLKVLLSGITVGTATVQRDPALNPSGRDTDLNDGPVRSSRAGSKKVPVYFRFPQVEGREQTYPFITIDYLTSVFDGERAMQGYALYGTDQNAYSPAGMPAGGGKNVLPIPMNLHYQVSTWSRSNQHDRVINTTLMTTRILPRYGAIDMVGDPEGGSTPDDLSTRRLDLLSGPINADSRDEQGKRVFRKIYTVSISSEMFEHDFTRLNSVRSVVLTVKQVELVNNFGNNSAPTVFSTIT